MIEEFPANFYLFCSKNFEDGLKKKVTTFDSGEALTKPVESTVKGETYLRLGATHPQRC